MQIEIVSDVVCPWCYVGKRRLEKALAQRPDVDIQINWQPFQLSPDMPREGRRRSEHYSEIFGPERAEQIMASMRETGKDDGIEFGSTPDAMSPNTLAAHALVLMAGEQGDVDINTLVEALFSAHHVSCDDIGDIDVLVRIATEAGMDGAGVSEQLKAGTYEARVQESIADSARRGVSGVPFFIIDGRYGLSGAQPPDVLISAIDQVLQADPE